MIHSMHDFKDNVLPIYLKHETTTSFISLLNKYQFHTTKEFSLMHCFLHEFFKREDLESLEKIKRKSTKKISKKALVPVPSKECFELRLKSID